MVKISVKEKPTVRCSQCGSELVFVSREKVQPEGTRYPQINTVYRCPNAECQAKKDKEKLDRMKAQQKRIVTEQERIEKIQERRKEIQALKKQDI